MENIEANLKSEDYYYTIAKVERAEIKVKGSIFIGSAIPVLDKEKALIELNKIRKEFYDATHNCFAWRIGHNGLEFRSSDDGEPSGSSGKPILFAIQKFEYSDILVVVTRYFGGTKLGVGGLARAYNDATQEVLELCERKIVNRTEPIQVFCSYDDISIVRKLVEANSISFKEDYRDAIEFLANVPISKTEELIANIVEMTRGRAGARKAIIV